MVAITTRSVLVALVSAGLLLTLLATFWMLTGETKAATITVTSTGDTGPSSLREAIANAASGDTIVIPMGVYTLDLGTELTINKSLTLNGAGFGDTIIQAATDEGLADLRVFNVLAGNAVTISGVTVRYGKPRGDGGGIYNSGTLTLTNSTVRGNSSTVPDRDLLDESRGGGIFNWGTLTLINSTVNGNTARDALGAVDINSSGGGIYNSGSLALANSTVSGNSARGGGAILTSYGTVTLNNSTLSGNMTTLYGGAIHNHYSTLTLTDSTLSGNSARRLGGGIYNFSGTLNLTNSTISGNSATGDGGGIFNNDIGTLTLASSTISGNSASTGGGIANIGTADLISTIIAGNGVSSGPDCHGSPKSLGYNLLGTSDGCSFTPTTDDLVNVDPNLGPLTDNGGPTETHALSPGSPAIDAITLADCVDTEGNPVTTDQRGVSRPQGPACDIGAYELEVEPPVEPDLFVYSAKIVCVPHLGPASPALMPGKYRTAVNVHNPWDEPAHIEKWVTLSPPQGQTPITGGRLEDILQPWAAFDVDCPHFRDEFGLPLGAKVPGGKGFLVIRSDRELDVVAVYTTRTQTNARDGVGTSVDVETIEPKRRGAVP